MIKMDVKYKIEADGTFPRSSPMACYCIDNVETLGSQWRRCTEETLLELGYNLTGRNKGILFTFWALGKSRDAQFLIFVKDTPLCCTSCIISRPSTQPIVSLCIFYVCVTLLYHCLLRSKWLHVSTSYRFILRLLEPTEAKLQLPVSLEHFTDHFAWQLAAQPLPLFLFAVSRGQRVLFQCISVSMKFDSLYLTL